MKNITWSFPRVSNKESNSTYVVIIMSNFWPDKTAPYEIKLYIM